MLRNRSLFPSFVVAASLIIAACSADSPRTPAPDATTTTGTSSSSIPSENGSNGSGAATSVSNVSLSSASGSAAPVGDTTSSASLSSSTVPTLTTEPQTSSEQPATPPGLSISPAGGLFEQQVQVTLTATSPTSEVRYTLDGTAPTASSALYTGPIDITVSTQVRAQAFEGTTPTGSAVGATFIARTFDTTSALPLIVVDGYGGGKPDQKIDGEWVTKDAGIVVIEPQNGEASLSLPPTLVTRAGYHVRGQSSASFEKAPYKIEFWDGDNQDIDLPLLGMPPESDWALVGPYEDRALVRHAFVYELGRRMGLAAPRFRFAEVYINQDGGALEASDYEGVYMVVETIKNAQGRLDLKQLDETDTTLPAISGGYIFKFDWSAAQEPLIECTGAPVVQHAFGTCPTEGAGQFPAATGVCADAGAPGGGAAGFGGGFGGGAGGGFGGGFAGPVSTGDGAVPAPPTCWADLEVVDPVPLNVEQETYLTEYVTAFNDAIHQQPIGAYGEYIDVASFIDTLIINEFTRNGDAYTRSVYFHKERDQKITAGPLWDFNLIMAGGGTLFCNDNPVGWAHEFRNGSNDWFQQLIADPAFASQVSARWNALRNDLLSQASLEALLAEIAAPLAPAIEREFTRWPVCQVSQGIFAVPEGDTWEEQLQVMRDFMLARGTWIDSQWQ